MTEDEASPPTWSLLAELLAWLGRAVGDPAALRNVCLVDRARGALIRGWLRGLEALARALLVAAAVDLPAPGPARRGAARRSGGRRPLDAEDADSARWTGVVFRCLPRPSAPRTGSRSGPPRRIWRTLPLALRYEALIRVASAPDRYVRSLARRLRADRWLVCRLLRSGSLRCRSFPGDDLEEARDAAWRAAERLAVDTG